MVPICGEPPETPLTLQETEVSEVFVTVAEKASVLPSSTVPGLGVMLTAICGGGGVVEPPPLTLAQAESVRLMAKTIIVRVVWPWTMGLRWEGPGLERFCERGRMTFAIADEGPAKERSVRAAGAERWSNIAFL